MKRIMATKSKVNFPLFTTVHPGSVLKEELSARGLDQKSFAKKCGIQASHLNEVIRGKRPITPTLAGKLEDQLGISAVTWLTMQSQYDCDMLKITERNIAEQKAHNTLMEYNKVFDVQTILKRLEIKTQSYKNQLEILVTQLCLPTATELQTTEMGLFRKSEKRGTDERMILTWVLLAKAVSRRNSIDKTKPMLDKKGLVEELAHIFNENKDTLKKVHETLECHGIKFSVVEKVDKASIDGFSFIEDGIPSIIVTMRYNRIDNLAFTVMHELCHVMRHLDDTKYDHLNIDDEERNHDEMEADKFASNALIPDSLWKKSPKVRPTSYLIQRDYSHWAEENGLNKWIVLGRISHETGMFKFKDDGKRKIA